MSTTETQIGRTDREQNQETEPSIRAAIRNALLPETVPQMDANVALGIMDCGESSTLAVVRSGHHLLDFDEFQLADWRSA